MRRQSSICIPDENSFGLHWGWLVVFASFLIIAINYGARYSFGIFLKPMEASFGWTRSVVSIASSLNMLCYGISTVYMGRLVDRFVPKWIITTGSVLMGSGLFLTSVATSPATFYIAYGVLCGIGSAGMSLVVCNSSVGKWFLKNRGLAIGISTMGMGFGSLTLSTAGTLVIGSFGWSGGFLFLGSLVLIIGPSLSQIFMGKKSPFVQKSPQIMKCVSVGQVNINNKEPSMAIWKIFAVLAVCFGLVVVSQMSSFIHLVAYATDLGISEIAAALSIGVLSVASLTGQFFFGWLSDRLIDPKYASFFGFLIMFAGTALILRVHNAHDLYLYAAVYGFGYGSLAPMMGILSAEYFGLENIGKMYGRLTFFIGLGGCLGPMIGGVIFDLCGSYMYLWYLNLAILAFASFLILQLKGVRSFVRN